MGPDHASPLNGKASSTAETGERAWGLDSWGMPLAGNCRPYSLRDTDRGSLVITEKSLGEPMSRGKEKYRTKTPKQPRAMGGSDRNPERDQLGSNVRNTRNFGPGHTPDRLLSRPHRLRNALCTDSHSRCHLEKAHGLIWQSRRNHHQPRHTPQRRAPITEHR